MLPHADIDLNWKQRLTEWCRQVRGLFPFQINQPNLPRDTSGDNPIPVTPRRAWHSPQFYLEVVPIIAVLLLYAGQVAPNVNETHYLTKAKHFWNPAWCPNDLFLDSSFSHYLFYLATGWLTWFVSLDMYAWIGRTLCWAGFAVGWHQLVQFFCKRPGRSFLGILLLLLLMDRFHLAGEWVIGGFEAKSISYVLVLFALERYFRNDWGVFWPLIGLACAFHVLAGGWVLIALVIGNLLSTLSMLAAGTHDRNRMRCPILPFLCFWALFALGVLPPLIQQAQVETAVQQQAFQVQVHERLPHHLLFGAFATHHIARFALLIVIWGSFTWFLRKISPIRSLNWFCAASLSITLGGLLLSGLAETEQTELSHWSLWATGWLRFYWFRLSDFSIPLGVSIMCVTVLPTLSARPASAGEQTGRWIALFSILIILLASAAMIAAKWEDPRPRADQASLPGYAQNEKRTIETQTNWKKVCQWIRQNTPSDAMFITPNDQQTFKWYAQRSEVVNWKDIPQNPEAILEWKRRIDSIYRAQRIYPSGLLNLENPAEVARVFGANYLLVEQSAVDALPTPPNLQQIYPAEPNQKSTYVLFQFNRPDE